MNEILHANIFFIIASIATVVFCILTCIILYHLIKVMGLVRSILERVEAGSEVLAEDLADIRSFFAGGGFLSRLMSLFVGQAATKASKRRRAKDVDEDDE